MQLQHRVPTFALSSRRYHNLHQRRASDLQPQFLEEVLQLLRALRCRQLPHRQAHLPMHHLYRLRQSLPHHRRTQHIVPVHHGLQRLQQRFDRLPIRDLQHQR
jgi:hypothetical protein